MILSFMCGYYGKTAGIDGYYAIVNIDIVVFTFFCNGGIVLLELGDTIADWFLINSQVSLNSSDTHFCCMNFFNIF